MSKVKHFGLLKKEPDYFEQVEAVQRFLHKYPASTKSKVGMFLKGRYNLTWKEVDKLLRKFVYDGFILVIPNVAKGTGRKGTYYVVGDYKLIKPQEEV